MPRSKGKTKRQKAKRQAKQFVPPLRPPVHISTSSITIGDHALSYKGCHSGLKEKIPLMLVRGVGIRDIAVIEDISIRKVLSVLVNSHRRIVPKRHHYDTLEVDEFWSYVGNKKNRQWLNYACHRESGEIVACVWGRRDLKTAPKLRDKHLSYGIRCDCVCTDNWDSFLVVFGQDNHIAGKQIRLVLREITAD